MPSAELPLQLIWVAAGAAVTGGLVVLVITRLLSRSESGAAVRELVRAIEDLGEGRLDRLPPVEEGEPLAAVTLALSGLAETLRRRGAEQERQTGYLATLLDRARKVGFLGTDPTGDVIFWSEGARELLGHTPEEVRGRPIARLFTETSWEALQPKLSRRELREPAGVSERSRMRRKGGGEIPVLVSVAAGPEGEGRGLFYTIRDASEIEGIERELREAEEKYRRLAEGLAEGAFVLQGGVFVYANSAMERDLGAADGTLAGRTFQDYIASEDLLKLKDILSEAEAGQPSGPIDCRMRRADGAPPIEVQILLSPARLSGKPAVVGSMHDVGATRRSWKQMQASEARLDATLEATSDGILMISGAAGSPRVSVANQRLGELLGFDVAELFDLAGVEVGRRLASGLREPERFAAFFEQAGASAGLTRTELFERASDGRILEIYCAPASAREGRVIGRVFSVRDVTGREDLARSRDALERANAELAEVNATLTKKTAELDKINQELRTLDQMKSTLLANVSHELQTPLVSIKGYTDMILKGRLGSITEEQKRGLEISLRNIDRLIGMIDNLLSLARSEKEMPAMAITTFPLWDLVEECVEMVREQADRRGVTLTTRYLTEDLMVRGDREKISQVFLNLLSNGIKFNRQGGELSISVRRGKRGYLIVEVRDTGIGIPAEEIDRIFDRFYRASTEGRGQEGSGLGLAIVKDLLRLHGCVVRAESRLGEGSVFTFTLPMAKVTDEDSEKLVTEENGNRLGSKGAARNGLRNGL